MNPRLLLAAVLVLLLLAPSLFSQGRAPRGDPQVALILKIESKLGKPLSFQQRKDLDAATQENIDGLTQCQKNFAKDLAEITGLGAEDIQAMFPVIGEAAPAADKNADKNVMPRIEAKLGRRLSEGELQRVREADQRKREAMQPVRENYVQRLAGITGLSVAEVDGMLPFASRPRAGSGGAR